jgi:hypothetical protein
MDFRPESSGGSLQGEAMGRLPPLFLFLLSLSACARYADLEPAKVAGLSIRVGDGRGTVCVNDDRARVVAHVYYADGRRIETWDGEGSRHGKLRLHDLAIASGPVGLDGVGRIAFPADPTRWIDQRLTFGARVPERAIAAKVTVTPRYDCGGLADRRGAPGSVGSAGEDGTPGAQGPSLRVALAWIDTDLHGRLMLVRVTRPGDHPVYHLVDPREDGGRFTISAAGGRGGAGGDGPSGASGTDGFDGSDGVSGGTCGDGTSGSSGGNGGAGGNGGDGGDGGDGGAGGTIVVETAPSDAGLMRLVAYDVRGGEAGRAGAPGAGGSGGSGGSGGAGGSAGSTTDSDGASCSTSSGSSGSDGSDGSDGWPGAAGRPGRAGPDGELGFRATLDPRSAWAREIAAGMRIALEPDVKVLERRKPAVPGR